MKKSIVIKEKTFKDFLLKHKDNHEICSFSPLVIMSRCIVEQVPETWEDLKELCENLEQKVNNLIIRFLPPKTNYDCEVIWFKQYGLWVDSNGFVLFKKDIEEDMVGGSKKRTPAQIWQVIKGLIGE